MTRPEFIPPATYFSRCREYRWTLWREWQSLPHCADPARSSAFVQFVCLNPSTADEAINDPTVSKCILLAKEWGFGALCVTNIFALRSTDPGALYKHPDPRGEENLAWIREVARTAGAVVCAWGNHGELLGQGENVAAVLVSDCPHKLATLAKADGTPIINKTGHPAHPLYQRNKSLLAPWKGNLE